MRQSRDWSFAAEGEVCREALWNQARYGRNWSFAERTISAPITPMKSARCEPNWSFANSQGSWFNGAGKRSGFRRLGLCRPLIDPPGDGVARVPAPPTGLGLLPARRLALRLAAGTLAVSYSRIGTEPPAADRSTVSSGPLTWVTHHHPSLQSSDPPLN